MLLIIQFQMILNLQSCFKHINPSHLKQIFLKFLSYLQVLQQPSLFTQLSQGLKCHFQEKNYSFSYAKQISDLKNLFKKKKAQQLMDVGSQESRLIVALRNYTARQIDKMNLFLSWFDMSTNGFKGYRSPDLCLGNRLRELIYTQLEMFQFAAGLKSFNGFQRLLRCERIIRYLTGLASLCQIGLI